MRFTEVGLLNTTKYLLRFSGGLVGYSEFESIFVNSSEYY